MVSQKLPIALLATPFCLVVTMILWAQGPGPAKPGSPPPSQGAGAPPPQQPGGFPGMMPPPSARNGNSAHACGSLRRGFRVHLDGQSPV